MRTLLPLLVVLLLTAGCQSLQFRGTSPNVRSFSEDPNVAQYYIGFDLEFAVVDPPADPSKSVAPTEPQLPQDAEDLPRELPEPKFLPF